MLKLAIDHEFGSRTWWQSGGQSLWDAISDGAGAVVLEDDIARSWLRQAAEIPGWADGHDFAPHPVAAVPFGDDEPEL